MVFAWIEGGLAERKTTGHVTGQGWWSQVVGCAVPQIDLGMNVLKLKAPGLPENLHIKGHALTACSNREMEGLLWQALESGRQSFMILSHNFELLNTTQDRPDDVVVSRFRQLCAFLDRNRDSFKVRGFEDLSPDLAALQPAPLKSPVWKTAMRMLEQAGRRRFG